MCELAETIKQIPRVQTNLEVIRSICERIEGKRVGELAKELKKSMSTVSMYLKSLERFGLIRKNGRGYELLKAGEEFLRLSKDKELGDSLFEAITKFGDPSDIVIVLKAYVNGQLEAMKNEGIRTYEVFVGNWITFLKHLGLISNGRLTQRGEKLLLREEVKRVVKELRRKPSLLARKALWCAGYEFRQEDLLIKAVEHDVGLKLVLAKLEGEGYRRITLDFNYGLPDAVLEKDGEIYVLEHKSKVKLDSVDCLQCLIYVLNLRELLNREVKLMLSNGNREVKIYDVDEKMLEDVRELIWVTAEKLIKSKFEPGHYCSFCGNENCPHKR